MKLLTSALILLSANTMAAGGFSEARCSGWGDNLNQEEARGRWEWAMKCDVINKRELWTYREYTAPNGSKRPAYPIYGLFHEDYTKDPSNPKKWFPPKSDNGNCYIPEDYDLVGFCAGGCYTADQMILLDGNHTSILDMYKSNIKKVMTLDEDSTIDSVKMREGRVLSYMKSIVDGVHQVVKLNTDSGKTLVVTLDHPLVTADGNFISAQDIIIGTKLLNEFGETEIVTEVLKKKFEGKVYNLRTDSLSETDKVISAQGLLNGDLSIQQRKANKANQVLLRKKMIRGELIK